MLSKNPTKHELFCEADELLKDGGGISSYWIGGHIHNEAHSKDRKIILSWDEYPNDEKVRNVVYDKKE